MNTPVINSIPDDKKNVVASGIIRIREAQNLPAKSTRAIPATTASPLCCTV